MDRFVTRQQRIGPEYPEGNQMIAFSATSTGNNITMPEQAYYTYNSGLQNPNMQYVAGPSTMVPQNMQTYSPNVVHPQMVSDHGQYGQYMAYSDNNATYMAPGLHVMTSNPVGINQFANDYQTRNMMGGEGTERHYVPQSAPNVSAPTPSNVVPLQETRQKNSFIGNVQAQKSYQTQDSSLATSSGPPVNTTKNNSLSGNNVPVQKPTETLPKKQWLDIDSKKTEEENKAQLLAEKTKKLYKTGTRVFSGSIGNMLKWHKMIQDTIGNHVMIIYDIIGKCVSISGQSFIKKLVVRDENGPAIQVVYYETDFLLPQLKPPCTVRVVGRIASGISRVQALTAFNVRVATGYDVAMLPRRTAVAKLQLAKMCEEYSQLV